MRSVPRTVDPSGRPFRNLESEINGPLRYLQYLFVLPLYSPYSPPDTRYPFHVVSCPTLPHTRPGPHDLCSTRSHPEEFFSCNPFVNSIPTRYTYRSLLVSRYPPCRVRHRVSERRTSFPFLPNRPRLTRFRCPFVPVSTASSCR